MRYLALIYEDETKMMSATPEEMGAVMEAYTKYDHEITESGAKLAGEALQPTATATTVRVKDGQTVTTDGPFAETKEQLGGFYMVEAKDLDEAIAWAAKIPGADSGSIEVRPILEFDESGAPVQG